MLFILRLRSAIFVVVTSAEIIPSRQRGQFASSYIRIGEFVPELPRNPNRCVAPDPESHERLFSFARRAAPMLVALAAALTLADSFTWLGRHHTNVT